MDTYDLYLCALQSAERIAGVHMEKFHNKTRRIQEAGPADRYRNQFLLDGYSLAEAYGLRYFMELFVDMLLKRMQNPKVLACGADPAYVERDMMNMGCAEVQGFDPILDNVSYASSRWGAQNFRHLDILKKKLPYERSSFDGAWMHNELPGIYWAPQLELCVDQLAEVIKPGGLVFVSYKEEPQDLAAYVAQMRKKGFDFTLVDGHIDLTKDRAMKEAVAVQKGRSKLKIDDKEGWRAIHWWNSDEPQPDDIFRVRGFEIADYMIGGKVRKVAGTHRSGRDWNTAFRFYRKVA